MRFLYINSVKIEMCIRDRLPALVQQPLVHIDGDTLGQKQIVAAQRNYPVSYTHLDVYKRQVHGLDLMVDSGHIEITVKPDGDDILLIVADDGIGMEPEQVAALLQNEPSDRTGIGVKNVNDRLRIYFGAAYGISIVSAPYEGTTVTIRTPRVPEEREADYDKTR